MRAGFISRIWITGYGLCFALTPWLGGAPERQRRGVRQQPIVKRPALGFEANLGVRSNWRNLGSFH